MRWVIPLWVDKSRWQQTDFYMISEQIHGLRWANGMREFRVTDAATWNQREPKYGIRRNFLTQQTTMMRDVTFSYAAVSFSGSYLSAATVTQSLLYSFVSCIFHMFIVFSVQSTYCNSVMKSQDTCVLSRDMVVHVSVLAQSRHLYVSSWLCLEFPCLVMSHVSCITITVHWQCLSLKHFNRVSVSSQSNPKCPGSSHVLLPVSCNVSCLKHFNNVSVSSCLSLILNVLARLVSLLLSWQMSLPRKKCLKSITAANFLSPVKCSLFVCTWRMIFDMIWLLSLSILLICITAFLLLRL